MISDLEIEYLEEQLKARTQNIIQVLHLQGTQIDAEDAVLTIQDNWLHLQYIVSAIERHYERAIRDESKK